MDYRHLTDNPVKMTIRISSEKCRGCYRDFDGVPKLAMLKYASFSEKSRQMILESRITDFNRLRDLLRPEITCRVYLAREYIAKTDKA
jgi:hypothetical protein